MPGPLTTTDILAEVAHAILDTALEAVAVLADEARADTEERACLETERDDLRRDVCRLGRELDGAKARIAELDELAGVYAESARSYADMAWQILGENEGLGKELAARDQALAEAVAEVAHLRDQLADVWRAKLGPLTINVTGPTQAEIATQLYAALDTLLNGPAQ
jgi:chromosome segregation ATPase